METWVIEGINDGPKRAIWSWENYHTDRAKCLHNSYDEARNKLSSYCLSLLALGGLRIRRMDDSEL